MPVSPGLRFWGTRGSAPTPQSSHVTYGGNTACVELRNAGPDRIVFDAGTGIAQLGREIVEKGGEIGRIHIFLSHFHWDHIQGLPFFTPIYRPDAEICFYAAAPPDEMRSRLAGQMTRPYFPVEFGSVASKIECFDISAGPVRIGKTAIRGFSLEHPQGSCGYRFDCGGRTAVYATDHEQCSGDSQLRDHAHGAQVLVMDAQYTPQQSVLFAGRGHSSWLAATHVARDAEVGQLVLFHHDPHHDDAAIAGIEAEARRHFPNTIAAREGLTVELALTGKAAAQRS